MRLFEITDQFKELEKLAITEDLPSEVIADTLEGLGGDFDDKAVAVAKFVLSLEASADSIKAAAVAMSARADRMQRRADNVRHYLLFNMQAVGKMRLETAELMIARRNNPPAVMITDEESVPDQFWVQPEPPPERLDKKAIKAALQAGERVEGAFLESGERLEIKL